MAELLWNWQSVLMRSLSPSITLCNPYNWFHLLVAVCQSETVWHVQVLQQPPPHKARGHVPPLHCQLLRLGTLNTLSPSSLFSFLLFFFLPPQTPCGEWFSFNPSDTRFFLSRPGVKGILRSRWAINKDLGHISHIWVICSHCGSLVTHLELSTFGIWWREREEDTSFSKPLFTSALHCAEWKWIAMLYPGKGEKLDPGNWIKI